MGGRAGLAGPRPAVRFRGAGLSTPSHRRPPGHATAPAAPSRRVRPACARAARWRVWLFGRACRVLRGTTRVGFRSHAGTASTSGSRAPLSPGRSGHARPGLAPASPSPVFTDRDSRKCSRRSSGRRFSHSTRTRSTGCPGPARKTYPCSEPRSAVLLTRPHATGRLWCSRSHVTCRISRRSCGKFSRRRRSPPWPRRPSMPTAHGIQTHFGLRRSMSSSWPITRAVMRRDHITKALLPLYLARSGAFLIEHAASVSDAVTDALESLCVQFEQSKGTAVERWRQTT